MSTPASWEPGIEYCLNQADNGVEPSVTQVREYTGFGERTARKVRQAAQRRRNGTVTQLRPGTTSPPAPKRTVPPAKPAAARRTAPVPSAIYWAAVVGVVVVAAITAAASYVHMQVLASANGQGVMSYALPISVDGIMLVATMAMLVRRQRGQSVRLAWTCLALGVTLSIVANIASAYALPTWTQGAISAWPPLLLLLSIHLLLQLRKSS
jgi:hypothetical protein